jgi:hypothetical protein
MSEEPVQLKSPRQTAELTGTSPSPSPSPSHGSSPGGERWLWWCLPLMVLGAFWLRVKLAEQPLWIDELHTAWVVQSDWSEVAWRAAIGNQSPFFFYLVKAVVECFGFSPLYLRLISIVAGSLQVGVLLVVLPRWTRAPAAGVVAATLLMVSPIHWFMATDARPYALIGLVATVQVALLVRYWQLKAEGSDTTARFDLAWVGTTILLFYLHYTTLLWSAALWIGLCWLSATTHPRPTLRVLLRWLVALPLLMVVLAIPGLWHLATILPFGGQWSSFVRLDSFFLSLSHLLVVLLLGPAAAGLIVQFLYLLKPKQMWGLVQDYRWLPLMVLTLCGLFLPPIVAALLTGWSIMPVAHWRYFAASVTAGFFLPGLMVGIWYWPRVRWLIAILMISLGLASNWDLLGMAWTGQWPRLHDEQWATVSERIRKTTRERPYPVILCPGLVEDGWLVRELLPLTPEQRASFRHYCIFALDGPYRIYDDAQKNRDLVFARPTDDRQRLVIPQADLIREAGGCFLVVRSPQPVMAKNIAKHFKFSLSGNGRAARITELAPVPVSLFFIELGPAPLEPEELPLPEDPRDLGEGQALGETESSGPTDGAPKTSNEANSLNPDPGDR